MSPANFERVDEQPDPINPSHYQRGDRETWEKMVALFGEEKYLAFCELNAFKYRERAGHKDATPEGIINDIRKAMWYEQKADELRKLPY